MDELRTPVMYDHGEIIRLMDLCLIAIEDGKPVPLDALDAMPPYRSVMLARVAAAAGVPIEGGHSVEEMRARAREVGGDANPGWLTGRACRTCNECGATSWHLAYERHTVGCRRYPDPPTLLRPRSLLTVERIPLA